MIKNDLKRMIADFSPDDLVDLVCAMRCASDEAERAFISFCDARVKPEQRELLHDRDLEMRWFDASLIVDEANEYGWCSERTSSYC